MKLTTNMLKDLKYTHTKNHINPKRLSDKFSYWTKMAITFGEECSRDLIQQKTTAFIVFMLTHK